MAEKWSQQYNSEINAEQINCDGCMNDNGRIFTFCTVCDIRQCCIAKGAQTCAHCNEYECERLLNFFKLIPESKTWLDEIKKSL